MHSTYAVLAKPRIAVLLVLVALTSAIVAGAGRFQISQLVLLGISGMLASVGSAFINQYLDRDIDAIMERTKNRPLPQGKASPSRVLAIGLALLAIALVIALRLNYTVVLLTFAGAFVYIVLYTMWLKRRSPLNIVIGGLSGSCSVLAGWFSVSPSISITPVLLALLLFLWTPIHFWSFALVHKESYRSAGIPMLPLVIGEKKSANYILLHSGAMLVVSIFLYALTPLGVVYLGGLILFGAMFLASNVYLWIGPRKERAWTNYKMSGVYLLGLTLAMLLDVLLIA